MKLINNRKASLIIMIVAIIFAILLGSSRTLSNMKAASELIFYQGENNDGYGIQNDLDRMIDASSRLISIATIYVRGDDKELLDEVNATQLELVYANNIHDKYVIYQEFDSLIDRLYYALDSYSLSTAHDQAIIILYYDISEAKDKIGHNAYNNYAEAFNQKLNVFPANFLSKLLFIDELDTFR